jgi:hypothetical protein
VADLKVHAPPSLEFLPFLIRMHPSVRCDLPPLAEPDPVDGRRIATFATGRAFQSGLQFPDRRIARTPDRIEPQAGAGPAAMTLDLKPAVSAADALPYRWGGLCGSAISFHS